MSGRNHVCEFSYLVPWLDPDHVAFTFYLARADGMRDRRSLGQTLTMPTDGVIAETCPVMGCFATDVAHGQGSGTYERWLRRNGYWSAFAEVYTIVRDYVMDHIHLRDQHVAMMREQAKELEGIPPLKMVARKS